jgi:hypothetical protein
MPERVLEVYDHLETWSQLLYDHVTNTPRPSTRGQGSLHGVG